MLFTLPDYGIAGIINYAGQVFDSLKSWIFLLLGVGLGLWLISWIYNTFSFRGQVRHEAKLRLGEMEEDWEDAVFEEEVESEMGNILGGD